MLYPIYLLKALGLPHILSYSALTGVSFGFFYRINSEQSTSFPALDVISKNLDASSQAVVMIISLIITVYSVYRLAKFFSQVFEHRLAGILTAVLGFSGTFLIMLGIENNSHVFVLGIGSVVIGVMITIFYKKKKQPRKFSEN